MAIHLLDIHIYIDIYIRLIPCQGHYIGPLYLNLDYQEVQYPSHLYNDDKGFKNFHHMFPYRPVRKA
jgi:hypothetical protein